MVKIWCCPGMFQFSSWVFVCFLVGIWLFGDYALSDVGFITTRHWFSYLHYTMVVLSCVEFAGFFWYSKTCLS
jgi:hypothetical protein